MTVGSTYRFDRRSFDIHDEIGSFSACVPAVIVSEISLHNLFRSARTVIKQELQAASEVFI